MLKNEAQSIIPLTFYSYATMYYLLRTRFSIWGLENNQSGFKLQIG